MKARLFALVCLLGLSVNANASLITELSDAGDLPGTAYDVAAGTTIISGTGGSGDVDLFRFFWDGGDLTIDTIGSGFDTMLYLFDLNGFGLFANDDASGLQSSITANLASGSYLVAVTAFRNDPLSVGGNIFASVFMSGLEVADGAGAGSALSGWSSSSQTPGNSTLLLNFSSATGQGVSVPEPGSIALLGLALLGLRIRTRR